MSVVSHSSRGRRVLAGTLCALLLLLLLACSVNNNSLLHQLQPARFAEFLSGGYNRSTTAPPPPPPPVPYRVRRLHVSVLMTRFDTYHKMALRSLLAYRTCPITFHLLVDGGGEQDCLHFFNTIRAYRQCRRTNDSAVVYGTDQPWSATTRACTAAAEFSDPHHTLTGDTDLQFRYYNTRDYTHLLGNAGDKTTYVCLIRLVAAEIFRDVDALLMVDTDALFVGDPCPAAHRHLDAMRRDPHAMIAMAPELSPFHTPSGRGGGVALNVPNATATLYGVNGGVQLALLERMRERNWTAMLRPYMREPYLELGDQIPINEVLYHAPHLLHPLPPGWNFNVAYKPLTVVAWPTLREDDDDFTILHGNGGSLVRLTLRGAYACDGPHNAVICGGTDSRVRKREVIEYFHKKDWAVF